MKQRAWPSAIRGGADTGNRLGGTMRKAKPPYVEFLETLLTSLLLLAAIPALGGTVKEELERGVLGLRWGASATEIATSYPNSSAALKGTRIAVRQPAGIVGAHADNDGFMLHVEGGRLDKVTFLAMPKDVLQLVATLSASIGKPRTVVIQAAGAYTHVYEWSSPGFGASIRYVTKDGSASSVPIDLPIVAMQKGPINASFIEAYNSAIRKQ